MPLPDKSDKDCVSKTISIEMKAGKDRKQAMAIALNHCGKSKDKKMELLKLKKEIINELRDIKLMDSIIEKLKKKLMRK